MGELLGPAWLWVVGYAAVAWLFSLHEATPLVPGTSFSLISLPVALLALALIARPWREAPIYALIHAFVGLGLHAGIEYPGFDVLRVGLEIVEAVLVVQTLRRFFYSRLGEPLMVAIYAIAVLALAAAGGLALLGLAHLSPAVGIETPPILLEQPALAWRYWWLGHSCSYLALAGPTALLIVLRGELELILAGKRAGRGALVGLASALLLASLLAFPVSDLSGLGLPPDVRQALRLLPLPFAVALAARFRGIGGAGALLILTIVIILSVTGPNADANWSGLAPTATPTQVLLLMTATACMLIAAMARQIMKATADAAEAREVKARFVAMLNHELRTPLNAILGFSELMRVQKIRDIDEAMGGIENIHASGQRLLAMIEGLLSQTDRGASAFDLHKDPLQLKPFVEHVVSELQPELTAFPHPVDVAIAEDLHIEADRRALQQILLVLLAYPLRFVSPWTKIAVTARQSGTDTVLKVDSQGLSRATSDERDKLELQLAKALALAHGARLTVVSATREARLVRLTFFATRAAG